MKLLKLRFSRTIKTLEKEPGGWYDFLLFIVNIPIIPNNYSQKNSIQFIYIAQPQSASQ